MAAIPRLAGAGQRLKIGNTVAFVTEQANAGVNNAEADQIMAGGLGAPISPYTGQGAAEQASGALRALFPGSLTQGSLMLYNLGATIVTTTGPLAAYIRLADYSEISAAAAAMAPIAAQLLIPAGTLLQANEAKEFTDWTDESGTLLDLVQVTGGTQAIVCSIDFPASANANNTAAFVNWILVG